MAEVSRRLGRRNLVYAGIRGSDVEPIADLPQLSAAFSIIDAYRNRSTVEGLAYEDLTGVRVDMETWDVDDHLHDDATIAFRRGLLSALAVPSALLPYRPSRFLSAISFARADRCQHLGLFGAHQAAFEHKPWVETALSRLGVPCIPWHYVADEEQFAVHREVAGGPVVLRRSRTSGGEGIIRVDDPDEVTRQWPHLEEAFVSVAPYLEDAVAVNVGATVWPNCVSVHHPSVQLIGIPSCVGRPFGYCGNDFGAVRDLDPAHLDEIERNTNTIGSWLRGHGYLGTFGVDYLIHEDRVLFTEVNPRFQGSTHASARLSVAHGEACLVLEHLAAHLGVEGEPRRPLREVAAAMPPIAHIVVHWTGEEPSHLDPARLLEALGPLRRRVAVDVSTRIELEVSPGAAVVRMTTREQVTDTGRDLAEPWRTSLASWQTAARAKVATGKGKR
jgi:hypothetical protein